MEKLIADVEHLQKQTSEIKSEMDEFCGTISTKSEKLFNLFDVIANKQDDLVAQKFKQVKEHVDEQIQLIQSSFFQLLDKLTAKFESQVDDVIAFKSQMVKHQVSSKSDCINLQKETEKLKKQLEGMDSKLSNGSKQSERLKEELPAIKNKLLKEEQASLQLRMQMDEMNQKILAFDDKVKQLQSEIHANRVEMKTCLPTIGGHGPFKQVVPEWVLRERKRNGIIIFGMQEMEDDGALIEALFQDLDIRYSSDDIRAKYRVGQPSNEKKRPIVIKFCDIGKKNEILARARNLKGKSKWSGVVITHDLTKMECHEEKIREIKLRQEVDERNKKLSVTEKQLRFWKVVGGRGERRVALLSSC